MRGEAAAFSPPEAELAPCAPTPEFKNQCAQSGGLKHGRDWALSLRLEPSLSIADLFRLIASLFAVLCAPAHLLARLAGLDARALRSVARQLERMKARGRALAYEGEDDAIIAARIDRAAWIARDPIAALKHMVRRQRGLLRLRFGMVAPGSFTPPQLACAPLCDGIPESTPDDSS